MKKIFLLLAVFSMIFTSCDTLEDVYTEIDTIENPIVGDANYTLTDEDYDNLELNFGSFSSIDDAKTKLPYFLSELYPAWGKGSSALINYKLYRGRAFDVENYSLIQDDYTNTSGSNLLGFTSNTPDATIEGYLVDLITDKYEEEENVFVAAQYYKFTGDAYTVTPTVSLKENLNYGTTAGDILTISGGAWKNHSGTDNQLQYSASGLSMTDYPSSNVGGALAISSSGSEDINHDINPIITEKMIYASALINLSEVNGGTYFFHLMEEDGSYSYSARVGAKDDGNGKILFGIGASSSSLTYGTTAYDLNTTYLVVSSYNTETGVSNLYILTEVSSTEPTTPEATNTGNANNTANRIGIRQGSGGPTGTIDGIRVANTWSAIMSDGTLADETVGEKESKTLTYIYSEGEWKLPPVIADISNANGTYIISTEDFTTMGLENFGSSIDPEDYLPAYLSIKFPYAKVGDEMAVLYKYVSSSSGEQIRGSYYSKTTENSNWNVYQSTIDTSLQFGHDGSKWVPDNTIKYTLESSDYSLVANALLTEAGYEAAAGNLDSFGNFNRTGGSTSWSDEMMAKALGVVLNNLNSNAENGQKYVVSFNMYNGSSGVESFSMIKTNGSWVINE